MNFFLTLILLLQINSNDDDLLSRINNLIKRSLSPSSQYSLTFFSTKKNDFVIKINSEIPLIPASTNKLFTSGIALMNFGTNFNINTELYCDDQDLSDGIINGNVYLKGYGDPTLSTEDLSELVLILKSKGINLISGNIIVDDSYFEETFYRNEWIENENISVALPPISSLTINNNTVFVRVIGSNRTNKPANISLDKDIDYFQLVNKTKSTKSRTRLSAYAKFENGREIITISGNVRRNSTTFIKVHIAKPEYYAGHLLAKLLRENGISFWGKVKKGIIPKFSDRICFNTTPLTELLKPINKNSNNFYSEHLFLILGAAYSGGYGSPFDASQAINTFLKSLNIYEPNFSMVDGSGISRQNQFSTETLVKFLHLIYLNPIIFNEFYNSLSIPQIDGTLQQRFNNLYPPERLRGKTGTLNGVTSLAGYVETKSNDLLIFSVNFNYSRGSQNKVKELVDKITTMIADYY